jgi:transglutaminase-like putative cysteine protease
LIIIPTRFQSVDNHQAITMTGLHSSATLQALSTDNDLSVEQTLQVMRDAVLGKLAPDYAGWRSEPLRLKAEELLKGTPAGFAGEVQRLFEYARDGIVYRRDQVDTQRVQDALQTIARQSGKCVDKVIVLAGLLAAMGYVSRFVVQKPNAGDDWAHVYLEVYDDERQQWIPLDPTGDGVSPRPLAAVGWRQPAHAEATFDIFKGVGMPTAGYQYGQSGGFDWDNVVNQSANVLGSWLGGPYHASTNAEGYPLDQYGRPYNPQGSVPVNQAAASVSPFGTQFNIPFWMWAVGGIIVGSYLFGKGRR